MKTDIPLPIVLCRETYGLQAAPTSLMISLSLSPYLSADSPPRTHRSPPFTADERPPGLHPSYTILVQSLRHLALQDPATGRPLLRSSTCPFVTRSSPPFAPLLFSLSLSLLPIDPCPWTSSIRDVVIFNRFSRSSLSYRGRIRLLCEISTTYSHFSFLFFFLSGSAASCEAVPLSW